MSQKIKNIGSIFCLLLIVGLYFGYYIDSNSFAETFHEAAIKFEMLNSLLSSNVQGKEILRDFSSTNELIQYLQSDDTNEIVYSSPDFVCHHFTENLIRNARAGGYRLEYLGIYGQSLKQYQDDYVSFLSSSGGIIATWGDGEGHAICIAHIEGEVFIIEPQSDVVLKLVNGKYVGVYIGEY